MLTGVGGFFFYELMPELKQGLKQPVLRYSGQPFSVPPCYLPCRPRKLDFCIKFLLGTDYPLISPRRYLQELASSGLSPAEQKLVCSENARRLFSRFSAPEVDFIERKFI